MTEVFLEYRPLRWVNHVRRIKALHPDRWEELTAVQLIAAACVYKGTISDDSLIASMLSLKKRAVRRLSAYQKICIIDLLHFMATYKPYYTFIIPSIAGYACPQPRLKNETFGCFIFAETYFDRYTATSEPEFLSKFIACLYRDRPFDEADIARRAAAIAKEPLANREAIFINYILIREWLVETYPNVFKPADDKRKKEKSSWLDVYDTLVGDNLTRQKEYSELPVSTVLRYLDKRIKNSADESQVR